MVLARSRAGGGAARPASSGLTEQRGSQSLELALVLPAVVLLLILLVQAGLFGVELVMAQGLAREAARVAAVDDDAAVRTLIEEAAGAHEAEVRLRPGGSERQHGDDVTAEVKLRARAFARWGVEVWIPAQATMRVEQP